MGNVTHTKPSRDVPQRYANEPVFLRISGEKMRDGDRTINGGRISC